MMIKIPVIDIFLYYLADFPTRNIAQIYVSVFKIQVPPQK